MIESNEKASTAKEIQSWDQTILEYNTVCVGYLKKYNLIVDDIDKLIKMNKLNGFYKDLNSICRTKTVLKKLYGDNEPYYRMKKTLNKSLSSINCTIITGNKDGVVIKSKGKANAQELGDNNDLEDSDGENDDGADDGTNEGTDDGANDGANDGADDGADDGVDNGIDNGIDNSADNIDDSASNRDDGGNHVDTDECVSEKIKKKVKPKSISNSRTKTVSAKALVKSNSISGIINPGLSEGKPVTKSSTKNLSISKTSASKTSGSKIVPLNISTLPVLSTTTTEPRTATASIKVPLNKIKPKIKHNL